MQTNYLILEKGTYKIVDSAKTYCKRVKKYLTSEQCQNFIVFYVPTIQGTHAIKEINKINNTNY